MSLAIQWLHELIVPRFRHSSSTLMSGEAAGRSEAVDAIRLLTEIENGAAPFVLYRSVPDLPGI